jgi:outer membrane protein OmpA-like peptidoglycan-associated protein
MDDKRKPALMATLAAVTLTANCGDTKLPPNPVPPPEVRRAVPAWFDPNARWDPQSGNTRVYIEGKIVFQVDKAIIRPESEAVLQKLLKFLQERPDVTRLRIEGHTDSTASSEHNQQLSARRALAVADWLVDRGIDHMRLVAAGYGEDKPIAPNELTDGRAENRRTEFHVMEVNGRPFGPPNALDGGMVLTVLSAEERERLKNPPKVEIAKPTFNPEGNIIKESRPQPAKRDENVVRAPTSEQSPGEVAPKKKDKKGEKGEGAGEGEENKGPKPTGEAGGK